MEVCGGQTYTIVKSGLQELLPELITLVHGPGCPVCVTPIAMIDRAVATALLPQVILCSFGDMLRVPGSTQSLLDAKALGADVRIVYSPLDGAAARPHQSQRAKSSSSPSASRRQHLPTPWPSGRLRERSYRTSPCSYPTSWCHPAMEAVLASPDSCQVQAFLAAGHACMVTGYEEYLAISSAYRECRSSSPALSRWIFSKGVLMLVEQLEEGRTEVENQYTRAVQKKATTRRRHVAEVFEVTDRAWRGIGEIPSSGSASATIAIATSMLKRDSACILTMRKSLPSASPASSCKVCAGPTTVPPSVTRCTPDTPLGAPMVSSEGACAAYFHFGRRKDDVESLVSLAATSH
jgi:hydrogenase expression/formation protein HypD